jgi:hypothetical protein
LLPVRVGVLLVRVGHVIPPRRLPRVHAPAQIPGGSQVAPDGFRPTLSRSHAQ